MRPLLRLLLLHPCLHPFLHPCFYPLLHPVLHPDVEDENEDNDYDIEDGYDDDDDKLIYAIEPLRSVRFLWENGTYCQEGRSALGVLKGRLSA